jgi:hypothetical protein
MSDCVRDQALATLQAMLSPIGEECTMKKRIGIAAALATLAVALTASPFALAKGREDVRVSGACTASSTSKLKLSEENGRIEVEFEVDQNRNGVRWNVSLFQNGSRIARLAKVTRGPSGSFEARVLAPNRAGKDSFRASATRASGEVCTARASW